jgi:hypothetical protein
MPLQRFIAKYKIAGQHNSKVAVVHCEREEDRQTLDFNVATCINLLQLIYEDYASSTHDFGKDKCPLVSPCVALRISL